MLFVGKTSDKIIAYRLYRLNQNDQNEDDGPHNFRHESLIAVTNTEVAKTAATDGAGHGGIADQTDDGNGQA